MSHRLDHRHPSYNSPNASSGPEKIRNSGQTIKLARATVELYTSQMGSEDWNFINDGIIYLVKHYDVYSMILHSTSRDHPVWEVHMDRNMDYTVECPYFHVFWLQNDVYGLNFVDVTEAEMFHNCITRLWPQSSIRQVLSNVSSKLTSIFSRKKHAPKRTTSDVLAATIAPHTGHFPSPPFHANHLRHALPIACRQTGSSHTDGISVSEDYYTDQAESYVTDYEQSDPNYQAFYPDYTPNNQYQNYSVPEPPPLPPPVPKFGHVSTIRDRPPSSSKQFHNVDNRSSSSSNSTFSSQIKREAKRRRSSPYNLAKYLP